MELLFTCSQFRNFNFNFNYLKINKIEFNKIENIKQNGHKQIV